MLPLCKFYRYLIYRLYHFRDDTPIINVIGTLTIVHLSQVFCVVVIIQQMTNDRLLPQISKEGNALIVIAIAVLHYYLFYNKKKWESYGKEFKDETPKHKKKGFILVLSYLITPIILFFLLLIFTKPL